MPDKAWKALERRVATYFSTTRAPVGNNVTRADTFHEELYIEIKQRKNPSVWNLWEKTRDLAKKEDKSPVVCIQKKHHDGFLIVVHCDDLKAL